MTGLQGLEGDLVAWTRPEGGVHRITPGRGPGTGGAGLGIRPAGAARRPPRAGPGTKGVKWLEQDDGRLIRHAYARRPKAGTAFPAFGRFHTIYALVVLTLMFVHARNRWGHGRWGETHTPTVRHVTLGGGD